MSKKILLADDSITIQKVVELTFSEGDYQVFAVGDGAQALRKIHELKPDIALLDVIMPEANGYEVCEKVKRDPETSQIPVLLLTGTFEPFDRKRAESAGADGHLTKPFESQVLIARVEELIASAPGSGRPGVVRNDKAPASNRVPEEEKPAQFAARPEPVAEEEAILSRIIPDRYDDFPAETPSADGEGGEFVQTLRIPHDQVSVPPETLPPPNPVAETWDELASGLSSAPEGSGFYAGMPGFPPGSDPPETLSPDTPSESAAVDGGMTSMPSSPPRDFAQGDAGPAAGGNFAGEDLDRIAAQVVERLSDRVVREIAWEVIPEIAEKLIRQRIRELEEKIAREG